MTFSLTNIRRNYATQKDESKAIQTSILTHCEKNQQAELPLGIPEGRYSPLSHGPTGLILPPVLICPVVSEMGVPGVERIPPRVLSLDGGQVLRPSIYASCLSKE